MHGYPPSAFNLRKNRDGILRLLNSKNAVNNQRLNRFAVFFKTEFLSRYHREFKLGRLGSESETGASVQYCFRHIERIVNQQIQYALCAH